MHIVIVTLDFKYEEIQLVETFMGAGDQGPDMRVGCKGPDSPNTL